MRSHELSAFLQQRIEAGDFPSAVYLVAEKGEIMFQDALGLAVVTPGQIPARIDTIYDVASLTKVLVTGILAAKLLERNEVSLESTLGSHLAAFVTGTKGDITIRELASHTSRLPAWCPFYLLVDSPSLVIQTIASLEAVKGPSSVIYSDLNFLILQALIEGHFNEALDRVAGSQIFQPLNLGSTSFNPDARRDRIAACEFGNEHEKRTCREMGYVAPDDSFRNYQIWGEVHDGNAWFMGGVGGHAGLFSSAEEVLKLALQFLPGYTSLLEPETCKLFRTNFTKGINEARSFAFELAETSRSTAGNKMSAESFGHLGFTGTSLWIDPVHDRIFILLTNRTHNHPLPFTNINSVRRGFHDLAVDLINIQN